MMVGIKEALKDTDMAEAEVSFGIKLQVKGSNAVTIWPGR